MDKDFTVENLVKGEIQYVMVKMKSTVDKSEEGIIGLFLGVQPMVRDNTGIVSKDEMFVWLVRGGNGDEVHILHTDHYSPFSVTIGRTGVSSITVADLEEKLINIHKAMGESKRLQENGLIDPDKYESIPEDVKKLLGKTLSSPNYSKSSSAASSSRKTHHNPYACGYTGGSYGSAYNRDYSTHKKKEITTKSFNRRTRYSPKKAIEEMAAKIEAIKAGKYKPPRLKDIDGVAKKSRIKGTTHTTTGPASGSEDEFDEYESMMDGNYGFFC